MTRDVVHVTDFSSAWPVATIIAGDRSGHTIGPTNKKDIV